MLILEPTRLLKMQIILYVILSIFKYGLKSEVWLSIILLLLLQILKIAFHNPHKWLFNDAMYISGLFSPDYS